MSESRPIPLKLTREVLDEAERLVDVLQRVHTAVGARRVTRHMVLVRAVHAGLVEIRQRAEEQLQRLGV